MEEYVDRGIFDKEPFQTFDQKGIGRLFTRSVKSELKLGICGEHGGDPASIAFCHSQGLTYVSCSPFRVPLTRLAAAQAAIKASGHSLTQDK
ncbi:TPA: pyruvate dikinase [Streptococcus pyogenes]|nr:pyruvate dikinase [Streptococcus pyogenes]HEP1492768.1 pyruvate dikinase [Streptococcus pyogenes]HEP1767034.1 pyruvate dikinase [Streptococcus pyogenes]HEP2112012.1 pyruvate dikinase [Streptococcus pyogenes]HEP2142003.1 pyruvate dikinase [Streptococcus pyogenes]